MKLYFLNNQQFGILRTIRVGIIKPVQNPCVSICANAMICLAYNKVLMSMRVSNLRDQREQHAEHNDTDIGLGQATPAWVGVHVAGH
jgi:hypothetical protein